MPLVEHWPSCEMQHMSSAASQIHALITDAQWLAHRYDPGHDAFQFHYVSRARHAAIPFLTDEYIAGQEPLVLLRAEAMAATSAAAPIHFIFHSAYCCSTLLTAAFDIPGISMGLKEPVLLNDLIGWRHMGPKGADVARVLDEGLRLLSRPMGVGEATVIKPSNVVNPLIPGMMGLRPQARALFLYAPLEQYLASIARKGMWGRLWVRDLFGKLMRERMLEPLGIMPEDYLSLTDIQIAAVGWLAQQYQFQTMITKLGGRVATLNSESLIADAHKSLKAIARLFELPLDDAKIAGIINGPVFRRDAKNGAEFARGQRADAAQRSLSLHAEEVEKVAHWARIVADNAGIHLTLPRSLLS